MDPWGNGALAFFFFGKSLCEVCWADTTEANKLIFFARSRLAGTARAPKYDHIRKKDGKLCSATCSLRTSPAKLNHLISDEMRFSAKLCALSGSRRIQVLWLISVFIFSTCRIPAVEGTTRISGHAKGETPSTVLADTSTSSTDHKRRFPDSERIVAREKVFVSAIVCAESTTNKQLLFRSVSRLKRVFLVGLISTVVSILSAPWQSR